MIRRLLMVGTMAVASIGASQGQGVKTGESSAGTQIAPAKSVGDLVNVFEGEMMSAAKAMPAEKYNFTPASLSIPGANFKGVRTFAEEVKHVAQSNYINASNVSGGEPVADIKAIGALKSKDEIVTALAASFAAVHRAVATLTPANQNEAVDDLGVGKNTTKGSEATWVAVHGFDHYGQMVEYLRLNGIVPPPPALPAPQ